MTTFDEPIKNVLKSSAMASGRFVDPWNVQVDDIHIEDIARGLAHTYRYSGQFGTYSVAQHSIYVARLVSKPRQLAALLHDGPEYLTGDLPHHIKHGPGFLGMMWRELDSPIQAAIERRFKLAPGALYDPEIKKADEQVFAQEWEDLVERAGNGYNPRSPVIQPWDSELAESEFLRMFNVYSGAS